MIVRFLLLVLALPFTAAAAADHGLFGDYVRVSVKKPPRGGLAACAKLASAKPTTRISVSEIADSSDVFFSGAASFGRSTKGTASATVKTTYNTFDTPVIIKQRAPGYALISITSDQVPMHDSDFYGERTSFYCRVGAR